jgi:hypothetical protein
MICLCLWLSLISIGTSSTSRRSLELDGRDTRELIPMDELTNRWNKELFPDHVGFLKDLHDRKLKSTLNTHPADGVRAFEKPYEAMCKALGRDSSKGVVSHLSPSCGPD